MAKAVARAFREQRLGHKEMHFWEKCIAIHDIASTISGKHVVIGSHHFAFEDDGCTVSKGLRTL